MSDAKIMDLTASLTELLREAYARGVRDERDRILRAASEPSEHAAPVTAAVRAGSNELMQYIDAPSPKRVAHGTVRVVVKKVLEEHPNIFATEVVQRVRQLNPKIAEPSIHNQLSRNRNKRYRRKNGRWSLIEALEQRDTAETVEDDHPPLVNGAEATA